LNDEVLILILDDPAEGQRSHYPLLSINQPYSIAPDMTGASWVLLQDPWVRTVLRVLNLVECTKGKQFQIGYVDRFS
jgi:hypothetical protein